MHQSVVNRWTLLPALLSITAACDTSDKNKKEIAQLEQTVEALQEENDSFEAELEAINARWGVLESKLAQQDRFSQELRGKLIEPKTLSESSLTNAFSVSYTHLTLPTTPYV